MILEYFPKLNECSISCKDPDFFFFYKSTKISRMCNLVLTHDFQCIISNVITYDLLVYRYDPLNESPLTGEIVDKAYITSPGIDYYWNLLKRLEL